MRSRRLMLPLSLLFVIIGVLVAELVVPAETAADVSTPNPHVVRTQNSLMETLPLFVKWKQFQTPKSSPSTTTTTTTTTTLPPPPPSTTTTTTAPPPPPPPVTTTTTAPPVPTPVAAALPSDAADTPDIAPGPIWGCIITHESRYDPQAVNPSSGASGLYQFLDSTWQGVSHLSGKASDYPENIQTYWALQLQAQEGWYPWKGDGCTPVG